VDGVEDVEVYEERKGFEGRRDLNDGVATPSFDSEAPIFFVLCLYLLPCSYFPPLLIPLVLFSVDIEGR
jgi:hypothetical protein